MKLNLSELLKGLFLSVLLLSNPIITYANTADWGLVDRFNKQLARAKQGNVQSMYDTGKLYERGRGVDKNLGKAADWFKKAADAGNASAQARLGILYFEGRGVKQNYKKATSLLKKAANANIASAQFQLANMYELGAAVTKNLTTAISWYKKADKNGYYRAKEKAKRLQQQLTAAQGPTKVTKGKPAKKAQAKFAKLLRSISQGRWLKRKTPVGYLPSRITSCVNNTPDVIHCISTSQERNTGSEVITYNTESDIKTTSKTQFNIVYSNNVLEVNAYSTEDGDGEAIDKAPSRIKTGTSGKKRKLSCQLKNNNLISCSKGNSQPYELISP